MRHGSHTLTGIFSLLKVLFLVHYPSRDLLARPVKAVSYNLHYYINDLNAKKSQPSSDLNPIWVSKFHCVTMHNMYVWDFMSLCTHVIVCTYVIIRYNTELHIWMGWLVVYSSFLYITCYVYVHSKLGVITLYSHHAEYCHVVCIHYSD